MAGALKTAGEVGKGLGIVGIIWGLYTIAVFVSTIVFLQTNIKGHEEELDSINKSLFMFLYVSYYIILGVGAGVTVISLAFGGGVAATGGVAVAAADAVVPPVVKTLTGGGKGESKKDMAYASARLV